MFTIRIFVWYISFLLTLKDCWYMTWVHFLQMPHGFTSFIVLSFWLLLTAVVCVSTVISVFIIFLSESFGIVNYILKPYMYFRDVESIIFLWSRCLCWLNFLFNFLLIFLTYLHLVRFFVVDCNTQDSFSWCRYYNIFISDLLIKAVALHDYNIQLFNTTLSIAWYNHGTIHFKAS